MSHDYDHLEHDHVARDHGGRGHDHAPASFGKAFAIGIALNARFVFIEIAYGFPGNSIALLAGAGHNPGDVPPHLFCALAPADVVSLDLGFSHV